MKIRTGFVSNSSSSSFIVSKSDLTKEQIEAILDYREYYKQHKISMSFQYEDFWDITEKNDEIHGDTMMDNFDMRMFMKEIGVDLTKTKFWHSNGGYDDNGQPEQD